MNSLNFCISITYRFLYISLRSSYTQLGGGSGPLDKLRFRTLVPIWEILLWFYYSRTSSANIMSFCLILIVRIFGAELICYNFQMLSFVGVLRHILSCIIKFSDGGITCHEVIFQNAILALHNDSILKLPLSGCIVVIPRLGRPIRWLQIDIIHWLLLTTINC